MAAGQSGGSDNDRGMSTVYPTVLLDDSPLASSSSVYLSPLAIFLQTT